MHCLTPLPHSVQALPDGVYKDLDGTWVVEGVPDRQFDPNAPRFARLAQAQGITADLVARAAAIRYYFQSKVQTHTDSVCLCVCVCVCVRLCVSPVCGVCVCVCLCSS